MSWQVKGQLTRMLGKGILLVNNNVLKRIKMSLKFAGTKKSFKSFKSFKILKIFSANLNKGPLVLVRTQRWSFVKLFYLTDLEN